MLDFVFDVSLWISGPALIAGLSLLGLGCLLLVRRWILPRLRITTADSEFSGTMVQAVMVFYGLTVALVAVSVWQTYAEVSRVVSLEATEIAVLFRDVSGYPEPVRTHLREELRGYVEYVIHEAWPLQRRGEVPQAGVEWMNRFQAALMAFEPETEGQGILHAEALRAYNQMIEARRLRLDSVRIRLPGVMWLVIVLGAAISLTASFFFQVDDVRLHSILVVLLSMFIALILFFILAMDRPFRGDLGIGPDSYQLIYDQIMMKR